MILPASDYQKIYLEKNYPEILKKISETIDENVHVGYCIVNISKEEQNTFNASEFESYLERLGFKSSFVYNFSGDHFEISWI